MENCPSRLAPVSGRAAPLHPHTAHTSAVLHRASSPQSAHASLSRREQPPASDLESPDLTAPQTARRDWGFVRSCPGSDRKSTRLNSSHLGISYAVFCLK